MKKGTRWRPARCAALLALAAAPAGCGAPAGEAPTGGRAAPGTPAVVRVVATTTLVGDVVGRVGGDAIALTVMLPAGADPHAFEPTPADAAAIADADLVFANGLGLEAFLEPWLEGAGARARVVALSDGIAALAPEPGSDHDHGAPDPHVWFDPRLVMVWADNAAAALGAYDPPRAPDYATRAAAYRAELEALDAWIRAEVATLPPGRRTIVADHAVLAYFCRRYGFEQVATIFPGTSTLAEPSAADLAALEDAIAAHDVPAVFVGTSADPRLARQIADDTGTRVVAIHTGSLDPPGGPVDSYEAFMRHNVTAIVGALGSDRPPVPIGDDG